ncbi:MAG: ATPase family associated with various cellular [Gemmataceae bacterium]|nr:ATPase family associated with various cellular [Gemmataceae bacterium]
MAIRAEPEVDWTDDELAAADHLRAASDRVLAECAKVIVGQQEVLEQLLVALLAQGHALLVGVPGLAKTLMIRTLADSMTLSFNRVQFTPDLMPSDITGTEMLQEDRTTGQRAFRFLHGPIFANVVLADEINRTPPKTQAALLEAMQERQVTVAGHRHPLPNPFFVLATQNPIEQEGTYPLPEAQQDRFMFTITVGYPSEDDEFRIIEATTSAARPQVHRVVSGEELLLMQTLVRKVPAAGYVIRYALKLARLTRPHAQNGEPPDPNVPDFVKKYVTWGAGPRAGQNLILAAKARALLRGRTYVAIEDVKAVTFPVMRHRVITNYNAEADRITPDEIVRRLLALVPRDAQ